MTCIDFNPWPLLTDGCPIKLRSTFVCKKCAWNQYRSTNWRNAGRVCPPEIKIIVFVAGFYQSKWTSMGTQQTHLGKLWWNFGSHVGLISMNMTSNQSSDGEHRLQPACLLDLTRQNEDWICQMSNVDFLNILVGKQSFNTLAGVARCWCWEVT